MLIPKLLRLEETLIARIETLATELSKEDHTSFSSLARSLIKLGLSSMGTNTRNPNPIAPDKIHFYKHITHEDRNDYEIQGLIDVLHSFSKIDGYATNHILISVRSTDEKFPSSSSSKYSQEHYSQEYTCGMAMPLNELKLGDELDMSLPNGYILIVANKNNIKP